MPELPEVEVLVRHLKPRLAGARITGVAVRRLRAVRGVSAAVFARKLQGARFAGLERRGKYLVFGLEKKRGAVLEAFHLLGHLGMTGRLYFQDRRAPVASRAALVFRLEERCLVFEDPRGFGRFTFDSSVLDRLGPEPLARGFGPESLGAALRRSRQAIKVRLLDQTLLAGVGNIYASEALFRAAISPRRPGCHLTDEQLRRLVVSLRRVLREAIRFGSTVPLDWAGAGGGERLFYFGRAPGPGDGYQERLAVYDRAGEPCRRCGARIRRLVQGGRSTFYCPQCQCE